MIKSTNKELIVPYLILFIVMVISIYPILYMISTSLMTSGEAANQYLFPKKLMFENYVQVWTSNNFQKYTINSLIVSALVVSGVLCTSIPAAYAFAKIEFPLIGEYLNTSIRQAGNFINPNNRTYKIELNIPKNNLNIKPNLNTKVRVNDYYSDNAILIKEGFISIDSNNEKYVYKIERKEKKTSPLSSKLQVLVCIVLHTCTTVG